VLVHLSARRRRHTHLKGQNKHLTEI
jgi:hypothetical protein